MLKNIFICILSKYNSERSKLNKQILFTLSVRGKSEMSPCGYGLGPWPIEVTKPLRSLHTEVDCRKINSWKQFFILHHLSNFKILSFTSCPPNQVVTTYIRVDGPAPFLHNRAEIRQFFNVNFHTLFLSNFALNIFTHSKT